MILKNKKQRLKKKRNNFIKTTLKLLKKKNSTTIMCANIYLQYCDLLVAYNDFIIYIFCWVIVVLSDKKILHKMVEQWGYILYVLRKTVFYSSVMSSILLSSITEACMSLTRISSNRKRKSSDERATHYKNHQKT